MWMNLENFMLSEIGSHREYDQYDAIGMMFLNRQS